MIDWPVKTLGEVCELVNGATPDTKVKEYWGGKHAWITPAEMGGLDSPFISMSRRTLSDKGLASCSATMVPPKTVILSSRAPIGHLVINEVPMATNQGCKSLIPKDGLDFRFLYYYLKANVEFLESLGTGTTFKELSGTQLKTVEIPIPPLEEQKRIVALLDAATARVTECTETTTTEIRLASNLYHARIEEILSAHALKGVREVALASLVELVIDHRGKTPNKLGGDFTDSGVPVVSAIHIKDDSIKWSERYRYVSFEMFEKWMPVRLVKGDILLTSEAPLGQVARIESDDPLVLSQRLFALRANSSLLSGDYLFEFLRSPLGQDRLKARATGATAVGIRQAELMKVMVPVPQLEDQPEMIREIKEARRTILDLELQLRRRDLLLKCLRQSIFEAAFRGDL